jgi:hypothetical protein
MLHMLSATAAIYTSHVVLLGGSALPQCACSQFDFGPGGTSESQGDLNALLPHPPHPAQPSALLSRQLAPQTRP